MTWNVGDNSWLRHQWTCSPDFFVCRFKREHLSWYFSQTSFHWVWLSLWWYFARIEWPKNMELYPASPREKKIGTAPMAHRKKKGATVPPKKHNGFSFQGRIPKQEGHKLPQGKALLILVLESKEPDSMSGQMSHHALDESRIAKHQAGQSSETYF